MGHTTVRIREETREALRALAESEGKSMQAVLEEAVEALRRLRFLERVNDAYAALRRNGAAWDSLQTERSDWDASLLDGLSAQEGKPAYRPGSRRPRSRK